MTRNFTILAIWLCLIGGAVSGCAQADAGTLMETVKDSSGVMPPDAAVTATNQDTGVINAVKTDSKCNYPLASLKIGTHSLSVEAAGFQKEVRKSIVPNLQQNIRLDLTFALGSVSQTADVTGAVPLLETDSASLGNIFLRCLQGTNVAIFTRAVGMNQIQSCNQFRR